MSRVRIAYSNSIQSVRQALLQGVQLPKHVRIMIRLATACLATYWIAIFLATHLPSSALPKLSWSDKVYHAGAFAGLAFLLCWSIPTRQGKRVRQLTLAASIAILYAATDELTQKLIPGRCCDFWDFAADSAGVFIGLAAYGVCRRLLTSTNVGRRLIEHLSH